MRFNAHLCKIIPQDRHVTFLAESFNLILDQKGMMPIASNMDGAAINLDTNPTLFPQNLQGSSSRTNDTTYNLLWDTHDFHIRACHLSTPANLLDMPLCLVYCLLTPVDS